MQIYNYDKKTKEFLSEEVAELDPIGGKPLIPANATTIKPLSKKDACAVCFDEKSQIWKYKKDLRGKEFWSKTDGSSVLVDTLDFDIKNYTSTPPKENQIMQSGKWVDDIKALKEQMISQIHQKKMN